jgi:DNA-damage-inducible protein J
MDTIQIRVDAKTKKLAKKIFADLGMDLSTGMKVYLAQVIRGKRIPFEIRTVNGFTPAQEARMIRETEWEKRHGKGYSSAEEAFADILK